MSLQIDDSEYSVHHRKEIVSILEGLKKGRVAIRLHTTHGEEFLTSVLDVSTEKDRVYLDVSADERTNTRIASSKPLTFIAQTGITVKWHSTHTNLVKLPDGHAFSIVVPPVLQRVQRRQYFRISLPQGSKGMICRIPSPEGMLEVPIRDMSAGGIGIALKASLQDWFSAGMVFEGCSITFPDVGPVQFKLQVCNIRMINASGEGLLHVGMEFMDISRGASNVIQRYLIQRESEK